MFKKDKKLTDDQMDILIAVRDLIVDGSIPFGALVPVYEDFHYSKLIKDYFKKREEEEKQAELNQLKMIMDNCREAVDLARQKLDECHERIASCKAELERQKDLDFLRRDEVYMKQLLWEIFNDEERADRLAGDLKIKEDNLRKAEEAYANKISTVVDFGEKEDV